jgi:hypothetical protein
MLKSKKILLLIVLSSATLIACSDKAPKYGEKGYVPPGMTKTDNSTRNWRKRERKRTKRKNAALLALHKRHLEEKNITQALKLTTDQNNTTAHPSSAAPGSGSIHHLPDASNIS